MPLRARDPERCALASTYWAVTLLLAALEAGQNIDRLARFTGCKRSFVARCARRLVDSGVWQGGETVCEWAAEREAHPSFWKDVAVAEGKLFRRIDEQGRFDWVPAGIRVRSMNDAAPEQEMPRVVRYVPPSVSRTARQEKLSSDSPPEVNTPLPAPAFRQLPQRSAPPAERKHELFPDAVWLQ